MAYATSSDLTNAYSASLLGRLCVRADDPVPLDPAVQAARVAAALDGGSGVMDGYFQAGYNVPVQTAVPSGLTSLRDCCCVLAVATLVGQKGYVRGSEDESLMIRAETWRAWLRDVSKGIVQIPGASASDANSTGSAPRTAFLVSSKSRYIRNVDRRFR
jgi:phage gp36-like protein